MTTPSDHWTLWLFVGGMLVGRWALHFARGVHQIDIALALGDTVLWLLGGFFLWELLHQQRRIEADRATAEEAIREYLLLSADDASSCDHAGSGDAGGRESSK